MNTQKIIDKICKCLRLSESCNPNEAALALRQAHALMEKYNITEEQLIAAEVAEAAALAGERYNPPFWALALSELVAKVYACRTLVSRRYGRQPEFRFIGMGAAAEIAKYTFAVLHRSLSRARENFVRDLSEASLEERERRGDVFAQAWLFRIARMVADFASTPSNNEAVDRYIKEHYGNTQDLEGQPAPPVNEDYEDILSGMRAASDVVLLRSVSKVPAVQELYHYQAS